LARSISAVRELLTLFISSALEVIFSAFLAIAAALVSILALLVAISLAFAASAFCARVTSAARELLTFVIS
jgi:hypothetical protein